MASDIKLDVTVHVSEMLKAMFGCYDVCTDAKDPIVPGSEPDALEDWQTVVLRRDGQRPLHFTGMLLVERRCVINDPVGSLEQSLSLYLDRDGSVIASLALIPSETRAAWPSFKCMVVKSLAELAQFLKDWQPERCFWQTNPTDATHEPACVAGPQTARSTFKSLTADCLSPAVLQG